MRPPRLPARRARRTRSANRGRAATGGQGAKKKRAPPPPPPRAPPQPHQLAVALGADLEILAAFHEGRRIADHDVEALAGELLHPILKPAPLELHDLFDAVQITPH